ACATYQSKVRHARDLLEQGQYRPAAEALKVEAEKPSDDQLIYLLDYATALQAAGEFEESNNYFQQGDELVKLKDYHSVSRIAGSLLFAEELVQYKGDDCEKLLINAMGALNYVMLGKRESALVEIRKLQEKLEYFRVEEN